MVGLAAIAAAGSHALVVCTSITSIRQWISEALSKTTLSPDQVGEWSGQRKQLRPITFVTYHALTWADPTTEREADLLDRYPHLALFDEQGWGLIVYDEVHLLPAPVFRATARIQAVRRLGLTATLVRDDNREGDIFSLVGPKRFDAPWTELESQGWIAPAVCNRGPGAALGGQPNGVRHHRAPCPSPGGGQRRGETTGARPAHRPPR